MRDEFRYWAERFPEAVGKRNVAFAGSKIAHFVTKDLPNAVRTVSSKSVSRYLVEGSAGKGQWAHTPWVAILDRAVTTTPKKATALSTC